MAPSMVVSDLSLDALVLDSFSLFSIHEPTKHISATRPLQICSLYLGSPSLYVYMPYSMTEYLVFAQIPLRPFFIILRTSCTSFPLLLSTIFLTTMYNEFADYGQWAKSYLPPVFFT